MRAKKQAAEKKRTAKMTKANALKKSIGALKFAISDVEHKYDNGMPKEVEALLDAAQDVLSKI